MKKTLITLLLIILLSVGIGVKASVKLATVINDNGNKLVVVVGSKIPAGYHLMTKNIGIALPQNIWSKRSIIPATYSFIASTTDLTRIATSTAVIFGDYGFDTLSLNLKVTVATTVAETISITPTYSDDANCASSTDASVNWYTSTTNGQAATSTTGWTASTASYRKINITGLATQCTKFVVYPLYASTTILMEGLLK